MKRTKALGAALLAALSGSLLIACSSDTTTTTATSPTASPSAPAASPLWVGTWVAEYPDKTVGVLELRADGTMTYSSGPTRGAVEKVDDGTYHADTYTLTYLTSSYCDDPTDKATYSYRLTDTSTSDQVTFTNPSGDDACRDRRVAMEGAPYAREAPTPSAG